MASLAHKPTRNPPIDRPGTLKDQAYREIKRQLVSGRLEHDHLYSAQHFAEQLGVSRTPVREALLQLASEGLLVCLDVRGFKIRELSEKEIRDVFETRELIETYVATRLAGTLTAADFRELEESLQRMKGHAAAEDVFAFLEADKEFHMALVRRTDNHLLVSIMDDIRSCISLFGLRALAHPGRFQEVIREHQGIVAALRKGERARVVQAVQDHLTTTRHCLLNREPEEEQPCE
jgi:DNA-binding GntR family transcriptional regulator